MTVPVIKKFNKGNCWFIAGCVGIMQSDKCFAKVVPRDQDFGKDYGGTIFYFNLKFKLVLIS
jgi:hypothetical protein